MEQYIHLLIARDDDYVPTSKQVADYLAAMIEVRLVPRVESIKVTTPSDKVRTGVNPFTGETVTLPTWNVQRLKNASEIAFAAEEWSEYGTYVSGNGRPSIPPFSVAFGKPYKDEPYAISVACQICAQPRSTSSVYDDDETSGRLTQFRAPSPKPAPCGYFTDPTSGATVEVTNAGRARFWIEIELGKWLFPVTKDNNLEILNPTLLDTTNSIFGTSFVQGCTYY
jgi:hypothetical protein